MSGGARRKERGGGEELARFGTCGGIESQELVLERHESKREGERETKYAQRAPMRRKERLVLVRHSVRLARSRSNLRTSFHRAAVSPTAGMRRRSSWPMTPLPGLVRESASKTAFEAACRMTSGRPRRVGTSAATTRGAAALEACVSRAARPSQLSFESAEERLLEEQQRRGGSSARRGGSDERQAALRGVGRGRAAEGER